MTGEPWALTLGRDASAVGLAQMVVPYGPRHSSVQLHLWCEELEGEWLGTPLCLQEI